MRFFASTSRCARAAANYEPLEGAPQAGDAIVRTVREQLRAVDANLPVTFVKSFRAQHERSAQVWFLRAAAKMFLTLGLAGISLR